MQNKKPRVIVFDIETTIMHLAGFGIRDQNFSLEQILKDWTICAFAAKVVGSTECLRIHTKGSRIDRALVKKAIKFLQTADVLVSQNGIAFDLPKINWRAEVNKIGPNQLHKTMHVDLLKEGRRLFGPTSHKLAWISKMLTPHIQKSKHSQFAGTELWTELDKRNPAAIKEMYDYNWQDILATEAVYHEYIKWIEHIDLNRSISPRVKAFDTIKCRVCSGETVGNGTIRRLTGHFRRFQCKSCAAITTPTGAGFNLDVRAKTRKVTPSKLELEKTITENKLLYKELQAAKARVEKLVRAKGKKS